MLGNTKIATRCNVETRCHATTWSIELHRAAAEFAGLSAQKGNSLVALPIETQLDSLYTKASILW